MIAPGVAPGLRGLKGEGGGDGIPVLSSSLDGTRTRILKGCPSDLELSSRDGARTGVLKGLRPKGLPSNPLQP